MLKEMYINIIVLIHVSLFQSEKNICNTFSLITLKNIVFCISVGKNYLKQINLFVIKSQLLYL